MSVSRMARAGIACSITLAFAGCMSIVKKPEIYSVKKIAVLSVYANNDVPKYKGNDDAGGEAWGAETRLAVADAALQSTEATLSALGWEVIDGQSVIESEQYQTAFMPAPDKPDSAMNKFAAGLMKVRDMGYFTPEGMHPIELASEQGKHTRCMGNGCDDPKTKLAELAKALGADAVAVVKLDYCYEGASKMGNAFGQGRAMITAGSAIRVVSKDGDMVVDMADPAPCEGKTRARSSEALPMINGQLLILPKNRDRVLSMFGEATESSLKSAAAMIEEAKKK